MSQYRNERRAYLPLIGDEVVVHGRFVGKLLIEAVDAERKTATLRNIRSNALITDVAWTTIVPLKHLPKLKAATDAIENGRIGIGRIIGMRKQDVPKTSSQKAPSMPR